VTRRIVQTFLPEILVLLRMNPLREANKSNGEQKMSH